MTDSLKSRLIGVWESDPTDHEGLRAMGAATLDFREDGQLLYTMHDQDADRTAVLLYRLDDGWLVTDQASAPATERTRIELKADGRLVLTYDAVSVRYIRTP